MAKTMARLENGTVVNIEWCSDRQQPTDTLVDAGEYPVAVGDTYADGVFYRGGERIYSETEMLMSELDAAYQTIGELIEMVYNSDVEVIG